MSPRRRLALLPVTLLALTGAPESRSPIAPAPADPETPAFARLLARHGRDGTIDGVRLRVLDYAAIARDPDYARALAELDATRPETMEAKERIAYWINAYNLLAIRLVADRYPVRSIQDIHEGDASVWDMAAGAAGGRAVTLSEIFDRLLADFDEPRIHFAIVAAAVSCPDIRYYDGARLDEQLDDAARTFLANDRRGLRVARDGVAVSQLVLGSHREFEPGGVVAFLRSHAPAAAAERLEGMRLRDLEKLPYDWSLNDLARASVAR